MAINFPNSPNINDTHTESGKTWTWDGTSWNLNTTGGGGSGGIALTDLSVTQNAAGNAALSYDNSTGVFSYTPPADVSLSLDDLTDVDTSGAVNGKILKHNGTSWGVSDDLNTGSSGPSGVIVGYESIHSTNEVLFTADSWTDTGLQIAYTPKSSNSTIVLTSYLNLRGSSGGSATGQQNFLTPGSYTWTCPAGVTSVCAVCIGGGSPGSASGVNDPNGNNVSGPGGGLGWKNNITVVPGTTYNLQVGDATGGDPSGNSWFMNATTVMGGRGPFPGGNGGTYVGDGGGNGGNGSGVWGGGGAGGYSGNGGNGGLGSAGANGAGGGGGGGGAGHFPAAGGGGVGIYGEGANGAGGLGTNSGSVNGEGGQGGSGGAAGATGYDNGGGFGSNYGGGGGVGTDSTPGGAAGHGAVRLMWGIGRSYPSTLTTDQGSSTAARGDGYTRIMQSTTSTNPAVVGEPQYLNWGFAEPLVSEKEWQFSHYTEYTNTDTTEKTFYVQLYEDSGDLSLNTSDGRSYFTIMEVDTSGTGGGGGNGGGGGSTTFTGLTDTPSSFTADKWLKVNSGSTAIEWASSPTDYNIADYTSSTSTALRTVGDRLADSVHLEDFRADDGTVIVEGPSATNQQITRNTQAFKNAIASGKTVIVPSGLWYIDDTLIFNASHTGMIGDESLGTTIQLVLADNATNKPAIKLQSTGSASAEYITLKNLYIKRSVASNTTSGSAPAPTFAEPQWPTSEPTADHAGVALDGSNWASQAGGVSRARISNLRIGNFVTGMYFSQVVGCLIEKCFVQQLVFHSTSSSPDTSTTGYHVGYHFVGDVANTGAMSPLASIEVNECQNDLTGTKHHTNANFQDIGFFLDGNDLRDIFLTNCETAAGRFGFKLKSSNSDANWDVHIIRPIIDQFKYHGILIDGLDGTGAVNINGGYAVGASGADASIQGINSNGIVISNFQPLGLTNNISEDDGIALQNCTSCSIIGNRLLNLRFGISLNDSSYNTIVGNVISASAITDGTASTNIDLEGAIRFYGASTHNSIIGNTVRGLSSSNRYDDGIRFDGSNVANNIGYGNVFESTTVSNLVTYVNNASTTTNLIDPTGTGGGSGSITINNNADNRIITASGVADTLDAEASLTYDGLKLDVSSTDGSGQSIVSTGIIKAGTHLEATGRLSVNENIQSNGFTYTESTKELVVDDGSGNSVTLGSGNIQPSGGIKDKDGDLGVSGQILSSTGTQLNWIDAPSGGGGGNGSGSGGGKVVGFETDSDTTQIYHSTSGTSPSFTADTWYTTDLSIVYTPQSSASKIILTGYLNLFGKSQSASNVDNAGLAKIRIVEGAGNVVGEVQDLKFGLGITNTYNHYTTEKQWQWQFHTEFVNSDTNQKTFTVQLYEDSGELNYNYGDGRSFLNLMEITDASSGGSGLALTDLSVTQSLSSGGGQLSYNNTSGVFTYVPPDLSAFLTSVPADYVTKTGTTLDINYTGNTSHTSGGYWIVDAGAQIQLKSDSYVETQSTKVEFKNVQDNSTMFEAFEDGAVILYHDNVWRLKTVNGGLEIQGGIKDKDGDFGTAGQVLSSTGGQLDWISNPSIALTDLSVTQNPSSGDGTLTYNDSTGVFTYTPPDLDNAGSGTVTQIIAGTGLSGGTITTTGTIGLDATIHHLSDVVSTSPSNGQILQYSTSNSKWAPADLPSSGNGTVTEISTGTGLTGGPITTTGTISLDTTGVNPNAYTSPSSVTVDSYGRVTGIVAGTAGATQLNELSDVSVPSPSTNQVLTYNGSQWVNSAAQTGTTLTADEETIKIVNNVISRKGRFHLAQYGYSATHTIRDDVTGWLVILTAGGGGCGSAYSSSSTGGSSGGGGGGGTVIFFYDKSEMGTGTCSFTIGGPGANGSNGNGGGAGGNSSFSPGSGASGPSLSAYGGAGSTAANQSHSTGGGGGNGGWPSNGAVARGHDGMDAKGYGNNSFPGEAGISQVGPGTAGSNWGRGSRGAEGNASVGSWVTGGNTGLGGMIVIYEF